MKSITTLLIISTLFAFGCNSGGQNHIEGPDDDPIVCCGQGDPPIRGIAKVLFGSAVEGLRYTYSMRGISYRAGLTDEQGFFIMDRGKVTFSVGDIEISDGAVRLRFIENPIVTPMAMGSSAHSHYADPTIVDQLVNNAADYKLSTDDDILNRTRFVLSLDDDQHLSDHYGNGVLISEETHTKALGVSINFKQSIDDFSADPAVKAFLQSINKTLITREEALYVLESGLEKIFRESLRDFYSFNEDHDLIEGLITWVYRQDSFKTADLMGKCFTLREKQQLWKFDYALCFDSAAVSTINCGGKSYDVDRWGINEDGDMVVISRDGIDPTKRWYLELTQFQRSSKSENTGVAVEAIGCPEKNKCVGEYNIEWID